MRILNRHHLKELPPGAVYVGRGTPYGNPYIIGAHGNRQQVLGLFHADIEKRLAEEDPALLTALRGLREDSDLVCSCAPKPCHAESIAWAWRQLRQRGLPKRPPSKTYAGIGSRRTPPEILKLMTKIAGRLEDLGYTLRSGAAAGADAAFEAGVSGAKEIFLPFKGFRRHSSELHTPSAMAYEVARAVHPAWGALGDVPKQLQARSSHQVLGLDLRSPAEFVVCWTPAGEESEAERTQNTGGTGQAISLADRWRIPVFNLRRKDALPRLKDYLNGAYSLPAEPGFIDMEAAPAFSTGSQGSLF
jgi:hypothetical protein